MSRACIDFASDSFLDMRSIASDNQPMRLGKWFEAIDDTLPDFISEWSFQRNERGDTDGWKVRLVDKHFPAL